MRGHVRNSLIALLLVGATVAAFWPATGNGFVFDDRSLMLANKHTFDGLSQAGLAWAFSSTEISLYTPLTRLSLLLDFQLFGNNPFGYHLMSLLLHGATSALVFLALAALTGALWRSLAVAALCALHPLRVEPAAWISGRGDVLALLFGLLALLAWERHLRRRSRTYAALAVGAFLLGMLSKPIVMTLPFALLVLDCWPLGRVRVRRCGGTTSLGQEERLAPRIAALLGEKAALLLVAAALVGVTLYILQHGPMVIPVERYPLAERAVTSLISYVFYIEKTIWPAGLTVFYTHRLGSFAWWEPAGAAALLVVTSAAAINAAQRRPYLVAGWLWFLGTLLPVIGLYQARAYPVADRYSYLPQIGLFVMAVWGLEDLGHRRRGGREAAIAAVLALIVACVLVSRTQVLYWKDDETLFRHALASTRPNPLILTNIGHALADKGKVAEALSFLEQAVRMAPTYPKAHSSLGYALSLDGRPGEALAEFQAAVDLAPDFVEARSNLGIALAWLGRTAEAQKQLLWALRLNPDYAEAHNNLGKVYGLLGNGNEAIASFRRALELNPIMVAAQFNLGDALLKANQPGEAAAAFAEVLRLDPGHARARILLDAIRGARAR